MVVHPPGVDPVGGGIRTQAVATLIAVYGAWLVTPLGWKYAGIVWGYAFAWFLVTDPVKLLAYKVLDTAKAEAKPEPSQAKAEATEPPNSNEYAKPMPNRNPTPSEATKAARADAKASPTCANPKPGPTSRPRPSPKPNPAAEANARTRRAKVAPETEPSRDAKADVETLLNTTLGDLLVAGVVKDPEDAGHLIAAAIIQAEAPSRPRRRLNQPSPRPSLKPA